MTPQFGATFTDNARVVIYDSNMFIIQANSLIVLGTYRGAYTIKLFTAVIYGIS